jgi:hypothetical protein
MADQLPAGFVPDGFVPDAPNAAMNFAIVNGRRVPVPVQGPMVGGTVYPMGTDTGDIGAPSGPAPAQGPVVRGQVYPLGTDTAEIPTPPPPQGLASLGIQTVSDEDWDRMTRQERLQGLLKAAGLAVGQMFQPDKATATETVEHPGLTLALAAASKIPPGAVPAAVRAVVPTRAGANLKFQEVMGAVANRPVETAQAGNVALRVAELAERGGTMPKVVRDLLRRATDPTKGDITYREMRDFYSNVSRLSADEMKRLPPVIKSQIGELRAALHEALARTAASGGKEGVYRAAMKEYAMASRVREVSAKLLKYGAGLVGAGTAYKIGKDILD